MKVTCPVCGTGKAKVVKQPYQAKYNGEIVVLPSVEMFHCDSCGEEFFAPGQAKALSIAVKNEVRRKLGLLPPEKIVAIREKLDLTQSDLERLLDLGQKVVTRWESGRVVQPSTADTILRMLDRDPKGLSTLKEIEKLREQAQRKSDFVHA